MIFSEKPVPTFPDHAVVLNREQHGVLDARLRGHDDLS
jgi:hypothetical protein